MMIARAEMHVSRLQYDHYNVLTTCGRCFPTWCMYVRNVSIMCPLGPGDNIAVLFVPLIPPDCVRVNFPDLVLGRHCKTDPTFIRSRLSQNGGWDSKGVTINDRMRFLSSGPPIIVATEKTVSKCMFYSRTTLVCFVWTAMESSIFDFRHFLAPTSNGGL